jgi:micrococcal nuclease
MRRQLVKMLCFLTLSFLLNPSYSISKSFGNYKGTVYIRNYDGDTITFNLLGLHPIIGKKINIRVYVIDTPEIRGKCKKEIYKA